MITIVVGNRYRVDVRACRKVAQDYLSRNGVSKDINLNIVFVGRRKMKSIASTYKNENVALPVLSFPYSKDDDLIDEKLLGEIYICYPQIVLLAAEKDRSVGYVLEEILYHGIDNLISG